LKDLPDAAIVEEYERAGLALRGTTGIPSDGPGYALNSAMGDPRYQHFQDVRREIFARGPRIVPLLLEFLRREVPAERSPEKGGLRPGFAGDMIELLVAMSNPRAVRTPLGSFFSQRSRPTMDDPSRLKTAWVLLKIWEGFGGKANGWKRACARSGLERLTHCAFLKTDGEPRGTQHECVIHPAAIDERGESSATQAAALFRAWFQHEGSDPAAWLPLARQRARSLLATDDIRAIHGAAEFLRPPDLHFFFTPPQPDYDDQPDKTVARLAAVIGEFQRRESQRPGTGYYWRGQKVDPGLVNWTSYITSHGPRARPYVDLILRFPECRDCENWGYVEQLAGVGGKQAMQHFVQCLTATRTPMSLHFSRVGIDRWAGRCFSDDAQRLAWWQANKDKSEEQWLRDSLPILAAQFDAGTNVLCAGILPAVLPECPCEWKPSPPAPGARKTNGADHGPSCVEWLKRNQARLVFDADAMVFRLAKE
jgi:hypothetical protein